MAYRFELDESVERGARRIAVEQIDRALGEVRGDEAVWVHEARKCLKRTRALLRLVRAGMDEADWSRRNELLQAIGRSMSARRDADVWQATRASLLEGAPKSVAAALAKLQPCGGAGADQDAPPSGLGAVTAVAFDAKAARRALKSARPVLDRMRIKGGDEVLAAGLERTHRRGRRQLEALAQDQADERFHDLRKTVQVHWRQMQLLSRAWPSILKVRVEEAREIANALGIDHDLSVFAGQVRAQGGLSEAEAKLIAAACEKRQRALRARALVATERLFMQKPARFADEVIGYWRLAAASARAKRGTGG
jgi:CHAD domain-containing protein